MLTLPVIQCTDEHGTPNCGACCKDTGGQIPGRWNEHPFVAGAPCPLLDGFACSVYGTPEMPTICRDYVPGNPHCLASREAA